MIKHAYIHIPFCETLCSYCDFCKLYYDEKLVDRYLDALEEEIQSIYQKEELETIYIGGGTPSSLSLSQLEKLFQILSLFQKKENCEMTMECNFENTTKEKLKLFKKNGVNRLSFGIETFSEKFFPFLRRRTSLKQVEDILTESRKMGFGNINVDLMYAFPKQSIEELREDLKTILSLNVEHISTYSLMIEDHTLLGIQKIQNISEDMDAEMYEEICKVLKENHYDHYEISNFCKEGYSSSHNLCYWNNEMYYGFGLGASSYFPHLRMRNTKSISEYWKGNRVLEKEELNQEMEMDYEVLLNLRKKEGISLSSFQNKYQRELKKVYPISSCVQKGFLEEDENHVWIPEEKWYISNEIILELLGGKANEL